MFHVTISRSLHTPWSTVFRGPSSLSTLIRRPSAPPPKHLPTYSPHLRTCFLHCTSAHNFSTIPSSSLFHHKNPLSTCNLVQNRISSQHAQPRSTPLRRSAHTPHPQRDSQNFWDRFLFHLKHNLSRDLLIVCSLAAGIYVFYIVSDWFSSITFKNIATWSFSAGVASTASVFLTYLLMRRYFMLRSSHVYKASLRRVLDDSYVRDTMGAPVLTSKFRAYSYYYPETGKHDMEATLWRQLQFWKPVHMQMLFKINGPKGEGMVSCDVSKLPSLKTLLKEEYVFHSLQVTLPDGKKVILSGSDADRVFQGVTNLR